MIVNSVESKPANPPVLLEVVEQSVANLTTGSDVSRTQTSEKEIGVGITSSALAAQARIGSQQGDAITNGDLLAMQVAQSCPQKPKTITPRLSIFQPSFSSREFSSRALTDLLFNSVAFSDPDLQRYNEILKGKARDELKKFKKPGDMLARKGDKIISVPVPQIIIPHFTRGNSKGSGGVGQGDGEVGTPIGKSDEEGDGTGPAGSEPGEHVKEIYVPIPRSEVAKTIIDDLKLPYLKPKGYGGVKEKTIRWNTKRRVGADLDIYETIKNALTRSGAEIGNQFDLDTEAGLNAFLEQLTVEETDRIFTSWREIEKPQACAVIIYIMDVSGSMTDEQKEMVRTTAWYLSTIIQYQFGLVRAELRGDTYSNDNFGEGIEEVFIIHDASAKEVPEEVFYTTHESGGTRISFAYKLAEQIIKERYDPLTWNVYAFHFSDGDNWGEDNTQALSSVERMLEQINEFGYVQVHSPYGSGDFIKAIRGKFGDSIDHLRTSQIEENDHTQYRKAVIDMLGEKE